MGKTRVLGQGKKQKPKQKEDLQHPTVGGSTGLWGVLAVKSCAQSYMFLLFHLLAGN